MSKHLREIILLVFGTLLSVVVAMGEKEHYKMYDGGYQFSSN